MRKTTQRLIRKISLGTSEEILTKTEISRKIVVGAIPGGNIKEIQRGTVHICEGNPVKRINKILLESYPDKPLGEIPDGTLHKFWKDLREESSEELEYIGKTFGRNATINSCINPEGTPNNSRKELFIGANSSHYLL